MVVLAVVLFLLVFLFTRWAISRREQNTDTSKPTTSETSKSSSDSVSSDKSSESQSSDTAESNGSTNESSASEDKAGSDADNLPAPSQESSAQNSGGTVPNTGAQSTIFSIIAIATITYIIGLNISLKRKHTASL